MDQVKRKVYLDLFASPTTLIPLVGGLTALLAAWATGTQGWLAFLGLSGVLAGVGLFASRLIFGLEKLTEQAYQYVLQQQEARQKAELEQLRRQLEHDQDPRTQGLLEALERSYAQLVADMRAGRIPLVAQEVVRSVEQMFHVCVEHLRRSYELWCEAQLADGATRQRLLRDREELVHEVAHSVEFLDASLDQLHRTKPRTERSRLARLRAELDENIRAARKAEERLESWGKPETDPLRDQ